MCSIASCTSGLCDTFFSYVFTICSAPSTSDWRFTCTMPCSMARRSSALNPLKISAGSALSMLWISSALGGDVSSFPRLLRDCFAELCGSRRDAGVGRLRSTLWAALSGIR